jgi:transcriptional regulator with XRE-family HTH domain
MTQEVSMRPVLVRAMLGEALREERTGQGRTLREISQLARVSLGYLSEIERGQKEASSELLGSICGALGVPQSTLFRSLSDKLVLHENVTQLPVRPLARAAA